jgi:DNA-binding transcriptional ArsR family regulator
MNSAPEPRFARIAALIADPTRSRMLALLMSGEHRTAGELAQFAGVTAQAATTQLAQLVEGGLLSVRQQGRYKYFALADAEIAHALEALSLVAERDGVNERWSRVQYKPMKCARRCYGHLAGELGVLQFEMLVRKRYLEHEGAALRLSAAGQSWLSEIGVDHASLPRSRLAYPCMDWSERKDHLAGSLAKALLERYEANDWLRSDRNSRALKLTPRGERELLPMLSPNAAGRLRPAPIG